MTGIILTHIGQEFDESTKRKIEKAVTTAIEVYSVTDFYFINDDDSDTDLNDFVKNLFDNQKNIQKYIIEKIREYKQKHTEINLHTTMFVARVTDTNYDKDLFDEIIQSYSLFYAELEDMEVYDAYSLRDNFLGSHIDYIFWCSNKILVSEMRIKHRVTEPIIIE